MNGGDHAVLLGPGDHRRIFERRGESAKARLGKPHALARQFLEVALYKAGLQDHRSGANSHAAGTVVLEAFHRGDGQRLYAFRILRPAGHMHFGGGDRRRCSAVHVAFKKPDGALPRRVVAEGDVHMGIDEAGNGGGAVCVDHDVAGFELRRRMRCPTWAILPPFMTIESPAATGSRQSPVRIAPRLTIAVFIQRARLSVSGSNQPVFTLHLFELQSPDTRTDPAAIGDAEDDSDFVRRRGVGQENSHAVIV